MKGVTFSILVVDDDADDRFFLDSAFRQIGYDSEVKKFISGEYLFAYLGKIKHAEYPSLIVLDNSLPKLDAFDILSILKSNLLYKAIPVVVYTGFLSPAKKQTLIDMGAYACFEKGISMDDILKIAKELRDIAESKPVDDIPDVAPNE